MPLTAIAAGALLVLGAPASAAPEISVSLAVEADGVYRLAGEFRVGAPREAAWDVLTDYAGIGGFVPAVRSSRMVVGAGGRSTLVEQELTGRYLWFERGVRVLLAVEEDAGRAIRFTDVEGRDFLEYAGAWTLVPEGDGVRVRYELRAKDRSLAPRFLVRRIARSVAADLLDRVRDEIARRALTAVAARPSRDSGSL